MRSSPLTATVILDLRPSPALAGVLGGVYLGAAAALWSLPLPGWAPPLLCLPLAARALQAIRRHALLKGRGAVTRVTLEREGGWRLQFADGRQCEVLLLPDSYVHHRLLVLRFAGGWRRHAVVVVPWMAQAEQRRRLTARLNLDGFRATGSRARR